MASADTYTAIIADDHDIVRDGLRAALQHPDLIMGGELIILAETSNGFETLGAVKEHRLSLIHI